MSLVILSEELKEKADSSAIAAAYDSSESYAVGDYCTYEGKLYQCGTATTGQWDSTKWSEVSMADIIGNIATVLDAINGEVI